MKTTINSAIFASLTLVVLAAFISFTNKSAHIQTAAVMNQQTETSLQGHSYSELLNGLTAGGR